MLKKLLQDSLKTAQEKQQIGLFIWSNWDIWYDCSSNVEPGTDNYNFALSQISKDEEATIYASWNGLSMPGLIAISVNKLNLSKDFYSQVLDVCKKGNYNGPITLIPSMEVIENN